MNNKIHYDFSFPSILNNNKISVMSSDSFTNLPQLERLKLSRNRITTISRDLFSRLYNLQNL